MNRSWENTRTRHGTHSGWRLHGELSERPCDPCYQAKQAYDKRRKAAPAEAQRSRLRASAQVAAYRALSYRYPTEYREVYEAECAQRGLVVDRRRSRLVAAENQGPRVSEESP